MSRRRDLLEEGGGRRKTKTLIICFGEIEPLDRKTGVKQNMNKDQRKEERHGSFFRTSVEERS